MERDLDLSNLLETGDPPRATPESLQQVLQRRRRFQARRHRLVASCALALALAASGIGIGLSAGSSTGPRRAASGPPAGLRWNGATAPVGERPAAPGPMTHSGPTADIEAAPGEFGFVTSGTAHGFGPTALPAATYTNAGGSLGTETNGDCGGPCEPVFSPGLDRVLFVRHVDGLTITASQVSFFFPLQYRTEPVGTRTGLVPGVPGSGAASSGSSSASSQGSTGSSGTGTSVTSSSLVSGVQPIRAICPSSIELEVTISGRGGHSTLLVPAGGVGTEPFSVLASAAAFYSGHSTLVLAVARTSSAVASVEATFASGTTDAMAPKDSWSVLAALVPWANDLSKVGAVRLAATSASGTNLETATLPASGSLATAPNLVCRYLVEPLDRGGPATPVSSSAPSSAPPSGSASSATGAAG